MSYHVKNLVSNISGRSKKQDPLLLNANGIIILRETLWVASAVSSKIMNYDLCGNKIRTINVEDIINGPLFVTSLVYNKNEKFKDEKGNSPLIIAATLGGIDGFGTIEGYFPNKNFSNTITLNKIFEASYRGLAMGKSYLYAADFFGKKIDVFGPNNFVYNPSIQFIDNLLPPDYSPHNIVYLNGKLFVAYAKQNQEIKNSIVPGIGFGFVNIFDMKGKLLSRFIQRGKLNAPWGISKLPKHFGLTDYQKENSLHYDLPKNSLLISNFGDGKINVFDENGKFIKALRRNNCNNGEIVIEGIRGIDRYEDKLFFASAPEFLNGLVGRIDNVNC